MIKEALRLTCERDAVRPKCIALRSSFFADEWTADKGQATTESSPRHQAQLSNLIEFQGSVPGNYFTRLRNAGL
jgi:hypothetical protein